MQTIQENAETLKTAGDVVSVSTTVAVFFNALPSVASLLTVIWLGLRIYESKTVQKLIHGKKDDAPSE